MHKVLYKNLRLYANKGQLLQALKPKDKPRQKEFAVNMLERIYEDETFLRRVYFSDEKKLYVLGKLKKKHNVRIWGSEHLTLLEK